MKKDITMAKILDSKALGTEKVVWDLAPFYAGPEDKAVAKDLAKLTAMLEGFERDFKGRLDSRLGEALEVYADVVKLMTKLQAYFDLMLARDTTDAAARKAASVVQEAMAKASGTHMTFFELEVAKMGREDLEAQMGHPLVAKHRPMLVHIRELGAHYLDEAVEQTLTLRAPFGPNEWADMMGEIESGLRFELDGKPLNLAELLHVVGEDRDSGKRARALKVLNDELGTQKHTYFAARTLNVTAGNHLANDDARGFKHAMASTNLNNMVDDATVDALHEVVSRKGAELARRYYKLKAKLLGMERLKWSDRNATMPFAPESMLDYAQGCAMVVKAYSEFSPTLGKLVEQVLDPKNGWVDAPPSPTKIAGAFDYTVMVPGDVRSYMLLNYLGNVGDVMTLAHELGHAVHGMLAAETQGPLMWHAPMPYAETASIFGEMLTFESLLRVTDDKQERLALYMDKMTDFLNTVVRQISFSEFEQGLYRKRREGKLSVEDFNALWRDVTVRFYGAEGEVFTYADTAHLWSYVSHFYAYRPFYVYAYAFGELFTQSLMATRETLGDRFEPLYLELLRAGGTKDAVGLMAPFGLSPHGKEFWEKGLEASFGLWIAEAEKLMGELGL